MIESNKKRMLARKVKKIRKDPQKHLKALSTDELRKLQKQVKELLPSNESKDILKIINDTIRVSQILTKYPDISQNFPPQSIIIEIEQLNDPRLNALKNQIVVRNNLQQNQNNRWLNCCSVYVIIVAAIFTILGVIITTFFETDQLAWRIPIATLGGLFILGLLIIHCWLKRQENNAVANAQ